MITGSESWPGYMVLTNSERVELSRNMLIGLTELYNTLYFTMSDARYNFDPAQFRVDPSSITPAWQGSFLWHPASQGVSIGRCLCSEKEQT